MMRKVSFGRWMGVAVLAAGIGLASLSAVSAQSVTSCGDRLDRLRESQTNLAREQIRLQSLQDELAAMRAPQGLDETSTDLAQRNADHLAKQQELTRQQILTEQLGGTHNNLIADYDGTCIGE